MSSKIKSKPLTWWKEDCGPDAISEEVYAELARRFGERDADSGHLSWYPAISYIDGYMWIPSKKEGGEPILCSKEYNTKPIDERLKCGWHVSKRHLDLWMCFSVVLGLENEFIAYFYDCYYMPLFAHLQDQQRVSELKPVMTLEGADLRIKTVEMAKVNCIAQLDVFIFETIHFSNINESFIKRAIFQQQMRRLENEIKSLFTLKE